MGGPDWPLSGKSLHERGIRAAIAAEFFISIPTYGRIDLIHCQGFGRKKVSSSVEEEKDIIYMKEKEKFGEVGQSTNERRKGMKNILVFYPIKPKYWPTICKS